MNKVYKISIVFLLISLFLILSLFMSDKRSSDEYFKWEIFRLIDSADDIMEIITDEAGEDEYIDLQYTLIRKIDRIRMFMSHSNRYINVDDTIVFGEITSKLRKCLDDGVVDDEEIQMIKYLDTKFDELLMNLGEEDDDGNLDVNYSLSVDEVSRIIENFEWNLDL